MALPIRMQNSRTWTYNVAPHNLKHLNNPLDKAEEIPQVTSSADLYFIPRSTRVKSEEVHTRFRHNIGTGQWRDTCFCNPMSSFMFDDTNHVSNGFHCSRGSAYIARSIPYANHTLAIPSSDKQTRFRRLALRSCRSGICTIVFNYENVM